MNTVTRKHLCLLGLTLAFSLATRPCAADLITVFLEGNFGDSVSLNGIDLSFDPFRVEVVLDSQTPDEQGNEGVGIFNVLDSTTIFSPDIGTVIVLGTNSVIQAEDYFGNGYDLLGVDFEGANSAVGGTYPLGTIPDADMLIPFGPFKFDDTFIAGFENVQTNNGVILDTGNGGTVSFGGVVPEPCHSATILIVATWVAMRRKEKVFHAPQ